MAGLKVLVVDDEEVNLVVMRFALELADIAVVTASSGEEALSIVHAADVSAAIVDIQMPGMSGLQLARTMRASPPLEKLPIIACTAQAYPEDLAEIRAAGCDACLDKPVDLRRFAKQVMEVVESVTHVRGA
jgi:two-component system cell cycle response regulator DivK